jgi:trk system potassium uptake protein
MLARLAELPLLVVLLGVTGALSLVPALHAIANAEFALARAFFYGALILLMLTAMLGIATAAYTPRNAARSHLAALVGAYLLLPVAMALPMTEALPSSSLTDAWFEMVSCFTTTGASVYPAHGLSQTIHLWRAIVGWYGGFLVLLAAYAVLMPMNLGGTEVASGRVPGRGDLQVNQAGRQAEPAQRLARVAFQLLPVFAGLTLVLWVGLLFAGETGTTALIHAMGTLSTSGVTGQASLGAAGAGLPGEGLIFLFFLFAITRRALPDPSPVRHRPSLLSDPELRLALALIALVSTVLIARHWLFVHVDGEGEAGGGPWRAMWGYVFTTASFLTTTGFISSEWQPAAEWSGLGTPGLVLMALAIIGGGTATTAGGVKLLRVYALLRHGERELDKIIFPNSISRGGADARRLLHEGAQLAWVFFMLFACSIAIVCGVLTLLGQAFEPALVLAIAALTTTGPLAQLGAEAPIAYATLPDAVKAALGLAMIVGRLETLALLALVLPGRVLR